MDMLLQHSKQLRTPRVDKWSHQQSSITSKSLSRRWGRWRKQLQYKIKQLLWMRSGHGYGFSLQQDIDALFCIDCSISYRPVPSLVAISLMLLLISFSVAAAWFIIYKMQGLISGALYWMWSRISLCHFASNMHHTIVDIMWPITLGLWPETPFCLLSIELKPGIIST